MATCPTCQFANPDGAAACLRCGQARGGSAGPGGSLPPGMAVALAAPLPAPMVEPIAPPAAHAGDATPVPPHVGQTSSGSFGGR